MAQTRHSAGANALPNRTRHPLGLTGISSSMQAGDLAPATGILAQILQPVNPAAGLHRYRDRATISARREVTCAHARC